MNRWAQLVEITGPRESPQPWTRGKPGRNDTASGWRVAEPAGRGRQDVIGPRVRPYLALAVLVQGRIGNSWMVR
jgi:hypothetical protein